MKNKLLLLFLAFYAISCTKEPNHSNDIAVSAKLQSDRLSFKSMNEFNETYLMLAKEQSIEDLQYWAQMRSHSTLLYSNDSTIQDYSSVLKTILNKDSEMEIGDSIIWVKDGKLYAFSKYDKIIKTDIQNSPEKFKLIGKVIIENIQKSQLKDRDLYVGALTTNVQHEFYQHSCLTACQGGTIKTGDGLRKWVTELYHESFYTYPGPVTYSYLHLRIKLEWKGRQDWQVAGELKEISVNNLAGTFSYQFSGNTQFLYPMYWSLPSYSWDCFTGPLDIVMVSNIGAVPSGLVWRVRFTGTVTQHIKGDTNAPWPEILNW